MSFRPHTTLHLLFIKLLAMAGRAGITPAWVCAAEVVVYPSVLNEWLTDGQTTGRTEEVESCPGQTMSHELNYMSKSRWCWTENRGTWSRADEVELIYKHTRAETSTLHHIRHRHRRARWRYLKDIILLSASSSCLGHCSGINSIYADSLLMIVNRWQWWWWWVVVHFSDIKWFRCFDINNIINIVFLWLWWLCGIACLNAISCHVIIISAVTKLSRRKETNQLIFVVVLATESNFYR